MEATIKNKENELLVSDTSLKKQEPCHPIYVNASQMQISDMSFSNEQTNIDTTTLIKNGI